MHVTQNMLLMAYCDYSTKSLLIKPTYIQKGYLIEQISDHNLASSPGSLWGEWRRPWYTIITDPTTLPRGFFSQCVIM